MTSQEFYEKYKYSDFYNEYIHFEPIAYEIIEGRSIKYRGCDDDEFFARLLECLTDNEEDNGARVDVYVTLVSKKFGKWHEYHFDKNNECLGCINRTDDYNMTEE